VQQLELAIDRIEKRIREQEPTVGRIFIEADALKGAAEPVAPAGLRELPTVHSFLTSRPE
jgi:hypothetical protein